jgi:hypothetical protein
MPPLVVGMSRFTESLTLTLSQRERGPAREPQARQSPLSVGCSPVRGPGLGGFGG